MPEDFPKITLLIVVRNEREYIKKSLNSLLNQTYPKKLTEIIIIDSESTDGTREYLKKRIKTLKKKGIDIKLFDNPKKILASGWNIGIKKAKGDIVIRIDAHSWIEKDFVSRSVEYLLKTDAACVGGPIQAVGEGYIGKSIAYVLSSHFGTGDAKFRHSCKEGYVDTIAYGAYWRKIFDEVGFFNENLIRNQDLDFHFRIKKKGGKFFLTPKIKSYYWVRSSIKDLIKQSFNNGYWNIITLHAISVRHFIPLCFVGGLLGSLVLGFFFLYGKILFGLILGSYILLNLFFSFKISFKKGIKYLLILPIIFLLFHLSYGFGSLWSIIKIKNKKIKI